jgi:hypothetical protein
MNNIFNLTEEFISSVVNVNKDRLYEEVLGIYNNTFTRRNRTLEEVLKMTLQGHILEQFLIDNHGFIDNTEMYLDLISPDGIKVDCKTIKKTSFSISYIDKIKNDMKNKNNKYNYNVKYLIVYIVDGNNYKYYNTIEIN